MRKCRTDRQAKGTDDAGMVYCSKHVPLSKSANVSYEAMDIQHGLVAQNKNRDSKKIFNEQLRGTEPGKAPALTSNALQIKGPITAQRYVQRRGNRGGEKHHYPAFTVST